MQKRALVIKIVDDSILEQACALLFACQAQATPAEVN
jgi:hypothetical protein